jgi:LysR family transcriptional regulator, glycine cleavage system transcriptional activator
MVSESQDRRVQGLTPRQRRQLPPFAAVRAFEAVGTCGGIRRAAVALSLDHAAVSRHLRSLEHWAGVPLADRAPGGGLTKEGARFHQRICAALAELASASAELTHRGDNRLLRVWCVPGIASQWLSERLGVFSALHPHVELEIQPTDNVPEFGSHEADVHISYVIDGVTQKSMNPDVRSVEIVRPPVIPVASREFLERTGTITTPGDLLDAPLLHEASSGQWQRWFKAQDVECGERLGGAKLWHAHMTVAAARRGQGIALSNSLLVADDLASGALVEVGRFPPVRLGGYVFAARRERWQEPVILGFRRWLENAMVKGDPIRPAGDPESPVSRC